MLKRILDKTTLDEKFIATSKRIKKEYRKTLVTALNTGLAFIVALFIKDLLTSFFDLLLVKLHLSELSGIFYQLVIALGVVAICVIGIILLSSWSEDGKC